MFRCQNRIFRIDGGRDRSYSSRIVIGRATETFGPKELGRLPPALQRRFTVRLRIASGLVAAVVLAAAGCSSSDSPSGGTDSKSFEFWSFTGINQKGSVDKYKAKHPDAQIKLTEVGSSVETAQALTTALAGGK